MKLNDNRVLIGNIACIDKLGTICMEEVLIMLPKEKESELNQHLSFHFNLHENKEEYF